MKVTRTPKQIKSEKLEREIANKGCEKCPCCGETKEYFWDDDNFGVEKLLPIERWTEKFFSLTVSTVDMYRCHTCGAEWESEPYDIR